MLSANALKQRILAAYSDAQVDFIDSTGTGDHFQAVVVSTAFEGKTPVEQHQLVYALFQKELADGSLHALALKTYTPAQWARTQGNTK